MNTTNNSISLVSSILSNTEKKLSNSINKTNVNGKNLLDKIKSLNIETSLSNNDLSSDNNSSKSSILLKILKLIIVLILILFIFFNLFATFNLFSPKIKQTLTPLYDFFGYNIDTNKNNKKNKNSKNNSKINSKNNSKNNKDNKDNTKDKYCYIGEEENKRYCINISNNTSCISGEVFPTRNMCITPNEGS